MPATEGITDGYHAGKPARPLRVLVVGAGIGGLTAAIALRHQGHDVEVFEQSKLAQETGAAIHLASNANGVLRRLGLKAEDMGAVDCMGVQEFFTHNGDLKYHIDTTKTNKIWQHPWQLAHRAHLHTALKDIATSPDGKGRPVRLHIASRVQSVDPQTAALTLEDGTRLNGDVLIGADGVHSRTRSSVRGGCDRKPFDSGKSAFRFLIPTEVLASHPDTTKLVETPGVLTMWIAEDRRLVMYPCVNNTMQNFVAIHPSRESEADLSSEAGEFLPSHLIHCE